MVLASFAASSANAAGAALEEVVVTARKTEESAQAVPVSIAALSSKDLAQGAVITTQDLAVHVPGLQIFPSSQGGAPLFAIRAAKQDIGTSGGIATYIDDVPMMNTWAIAKSMYDLESVSVLKGPQGTLFGVNATGGAVIFRPNKPTQSFEGYAQIGAGNYNYKQFQGMVNLPINDMFQLRAAGEVVRRDGYVKNITPSNGNTRMDDDDHESYRLALMMRLTDNMTNLLSGDYYHEEGQPQASKDIGFNDPLLGFFYPGNNISAVQSSLDVRTVSIQKVTFKKLTNWGASDVFTYDVNDNFGFKNVLGYRHDHDDLSEDWDGTQFPMVEGRSLYKNKQVTEELTAHLNSSDSKLRLIAGIFYSHQTLNTSVAGATFEQTPIVSDSNQIYETKRESFAIYSQISYDITDDITVTFGGRHNWDKGDIDLQYRSGILHNTGDFNAGTCVPGTNAYNIISFFPNFNQAGCSASVSKKWNAPSWTFTLEDKVGPSSRIYFTTRGGYQAGGFNNLVREVQYQTYDPEKVVDFEVGMKSDWDLAGRPVRTNFAGFYGKYNDMQRVENGAYANPPGLYVAVFNAGAATFYGLEFEGSIYLTDSLELGTSWTRVVAAYDRFQFPAVGTTPTADLSGYPLAQTPRDTVSWNLIYTLPIPDTVGTVSTALSGFYRSPTTFSDTSQGAAFDHFNRQGGYSVYNATADWKNIFNSHVDLGLFVRNLSDKLYANSINNQMGGLGLAWAFYGPPRTYGATLRYNF